MSSDILCIHDFDLHDEIFFFFFPDPVSYFRWITYLIYWTTYFCFWFGLLICWFSFWCQGTTPQGVIRLRPSLGLVGLRSARPRVVSRKAVAIGWVLILIMARTILWLGWLMSIFWERFARQIEDSPSLSFHLPGPFLYHVFFHFFFF